MWIVCLSTASVFVTANLRCVAKMGSCSPFLLACWEDSFVGSSASYAAFQGGLQERTLIDRVGGLLSGGLLGQAISGRLPGTFQAAKAAPLCCSGFGRCKLSYRGLHCLFYMQVSNACGTERHTAVRCPRVSCQYELGGARDDWLGGEAMACVSGCCHCGLFAAFPLKRMRR